MRKTVYAVAATIIAAAPFVSPAFAGGHAAPAVSHIRPAEQFTPPAVSHVTPSEQFTPPAARTAPSDAVLGGNKVRPAEQFTPPAGTPVNPDEQFTPPA